MKLSQSERETLIGPAVIGIFVGTLFAVALSLSAASTSQPLRLLVDNKPCDAELSRRPSTGVSPTWLSTCSDWTSQI